MTNPMKTNKKIIPLEYCPDDCFDILRIRNSGGRYLRKPGLGIRLKGEINESKARRKRFK